MSDLNRRTFGATVVGGITASAVGAEEKSDEPAVGPIVGHVSSSRAMIWYRPGIAGKYELRIRRPGQQNSDSFQAVSDPENDLCVIWEIPDLKTATNYEYEILKDGKLISGGASQSFKTGPAEDARTKTSLAFGSCAESSPLKLWRQMAENDAEGLILLGDTPYIDSTSLEVQRARHREFLSIPELSEFGRSRPVWGTWDDHDFGRNDSDGNLPGKRIPAKHLQNIAR